ncbi:MAG: PASTA domain-containing protein [Acidobacteriia bacterium]|nr:PASTA domain-containing protein [Terriglobia bacterium]
MFAEKLKVLSQTFLTLFILLSAGFLSAITAMRFAIRGQIVTVPAIVGMSLSQAEQTLAGRKLLLKVETRVYNDHVSEGAVVSVDPPVGAELKTRSRVNVITSLGPLRVPIPDLVGGTLRAAQIDLVRRGLALGLVARVDDAQVEKDHIASQEPPANSKEVLNPTVNVLLSDGPTTRAFLVPDMVGMDLNTASALVVREGFERGRVVSQSYPDVSSGIVLSQQPSAGSRVLAGATIDFTVSK